MIFLVNKNIVIGTQILLLMYVLMFFYFTNKDQNSNEKKFDVLKVHAEIVTFLRLKVRVLQIEFF